MQNILDYINRVTRKGAGPLHSPPTTISPTQHHHHTPHPAPIGHHSDITMQGAPASNALSHPCNITEPVPGSVIYGVHGLYWLGSVLMRATRLQICNPLALRQLEGIGSTADAMFKWAGRAPSKSRPFSGIIYLPLPTIPLSRIIYPFLKNTTIFSRIIYPFLKNLAKTNLKKNLKIFPELILA